MPDKTYILQLKDGAQRRVTVPSSYKITFGPMVPGVRMEEPGKTGRGALRIYDGETQVACFTDVIAFRDGALRIEEKTVRVERRAMGKRDRDGGRDVTVEARIEEWVNPDEPQRGNAGEHLKGLTFASEEDF